MEFVELEKQEFSDFASKHPLKSFFQTVEMEQLGKYSGWTSYYVGVKEQKQIIAATRMMSYKNRLGLHYFYAPRGLLLDYHNEPLLSFFTQNLKTYIKKKKGYMLRIDPLIKHFKRDADGNIIPTDYDPEWCTKSLKKLGYHHLGYHVGYSDILQCRWVHCLDLEGKTEEEVLKGMRATARNQIKKTLSIGGVCIRELGKEELPLFKKITEEASERKNFHDKTLSYYENMYELFSKNHQVKFMIAELYPKIYLEGLEKEKQEWIQKLEHLTNHPRNEGKKKEIHVALESTQKRIERVKRLCEQEVIPLAASMFMLYGEEILYYHSGNYKEYIEFNGQRLIQWKMIQYGLQNGFKRYNFYGISGIFNEEDPDSGVYEFKRGFGGYVEEYIGEFDLPISWYYFIRKLFSKGGSL